MFISPITAIEQGWVKFPKWVSVEEQKKYIQPNALDFSLDKVFTIDSSAPFIVSETNKQMRGGVELLPNAALVDSHWKLEGNTSYDGMSDFYVELPEGVAAMFIVRSTFNRNGIFITSGLYDSGFKGNCGVAIHNNSGEAYIGQHTRIGQLIFIRSETSGVMYSGGYNTSNGQHWSEKK